MTRNTPEHRRDHMLTNTMYNRMKWVTLVFLPAVGAAYFSLSELLGLPFGDEVVGTIVIICTFFGNLIGISNKQYNSSESKFDGSLVLTPGEDDDSTDLRFQMEAAKLIEKNQVLLKVDKTAV